MLSIYEMVFLIIKEETILNKRLKRTLIGFEIKSNLADIIDWEKIFIYPLLVE